MWVLRAKALLASLGLVSCAPEAVEIKNIALLGQETSAPPHQQRAEIEKAVSVFSNGRFATGAVRWFIVPAEISPISVQSFFDSGLRDSKVKARRIVESGPDDSPAALYSWRTKGGDKGVLAAVIAEPANKAPGLVAYYQITISKGWNPPLVSSGNDG